jgi:hypothetical protein
MTDLRCLPQLLVLARSLASHSPGARLRVLCMDLPSLSFLARRRVAGVSPVALDALEEADPELRAVREGRLWHEYCWSAVPAFCLSALTRAQPPDVAIWLDADLMFFAGADSLLAELGDASVLLVPHRYFQLYPSAARAPYLKATYGSFNGGTVVVRRDELGMTALRRWRARTLEWCRDAPEPGRFGNQLHLEDLPDQLAGVRVAEDPAIGLAPWNAGQHRLGGADQAPLVDGRPVAFYHYQSLRLRRLPPRLRGAPRPPSYLRLPRVADSPALVARTKPWFRLTRAERRLLWRPYLRELAPAVAEVAVAEPRLMATVPGLGAGELVRDWRCKLRLNLDRRWVGRAREALTGWRARRAGERPSSPPGPGAVREPLVDFEQRLRDH